MRDGATIVAWWGSKCQEVIDRHQGRGPWRTARCSRRQHPSLSAHRWSRGASLVPQRTQPRAALRRCLVIIVVAEAKTCVGDPCECGATGATAQATPHAHIEGHVSYDCSCRHTCTLPGRCTDARRSGDAVTMHTLMHAPHKPSEHRRASTCRHTAPHRPRGVSRHPSSCSLSRTGHALPTRHAAPSCWHAIYTLLLVLQLLTHSTATPSFFKQQQPLIHGK